MRFHPSSVSNGVSFRVPAAVATIRAGGTYMRSKAPGRGSPVSAARPDRRHDVALGRYASRPGAISRRGWRQVIHRTYLEIISDRISLIAAGCAFYATLALFPA